MSKKFSNQEIAEKFEHLFLKGWSLSEDKIYLQKRRQHKCDSCTLYKSTAKYSSTM